MRTDPIHAAVDFAELVNQLFAALIATAPGTPQQTEPSLGGKLLYVAELDPLGRPLVVAANIAGAASLAATTDQDAQKQAIRDGVVDFLVNSLDEALRILKNQVRKRETVAVCVAGAPEAVEREMLERGVLPDLLPPGEGIRSKIDIFLKQGARRVQIVPEDQRQVLLAWHVAQEPARWLAKLDNVALDCLNAEDWQARRWLRLAPRYLGRLAQGVRLLACDQESAERLINAIRNEVNRGDIPVPVEFLVRGPGPRPEHRLRFEKL
ncbi:MAG: hypothetical protein ABR976_10360 [Terracidiphilus sp.]|jgi:urocanate hydratase